MIFFSSQDASCVDKCQFLHSYVFWVTSQEKAVVSSFCLCSTINVFDWDLLWQCVSLTLVQTFHDWPLWNWFICLCTLPDIRQNHEPEDFCLQESVNSTGVSGGNFFSLLSLLWAFTHNASGILRLFTLLQCKNKTISRWPESVVALRNQVALIKTMFQTTFVTPSLSVIPEYPESICGCVIAVIWGARRWYDWCFSGCGLNSKETD